MLLRESLLSLIAAMRRRVSIAEGLDRPQDANFLGWIELLMNEVCGGGSNKELRQHLKNTAKETWQLANWLTHTRSATNTSSTIALQSCQTIAGHFIQILEGGRADRIGSCPVCKSRDVRSHFDAAISPDGDYYSSCGVCEWNDHPGYGTEANGIL